METYVNRINFNFSRSQLLHDNIHTVLKNTQIALETENVVINNIYIV